MVAQLVWDQWVGGSNPLSPTTFEPRLNKAGFFVFCILKTSHFTVLRISDNPTYLCRQLVTSNLLIYKGVGCLALWLSPVGDNKASGTVAKLGRLPPQSAIFLLSEKNLSVLFC